MNIYKLLRARWIETGVSVNEGISQAAIDCFEEKHQIILPIAFKEYMQTVNGMLEGQTDANLVSFLSLEMIDQDPNFKALPGHFVEIVVAEFCLYCHWYVLRSSRSGNESIVLGINGDQEKQIANSFEDFLNKYMSDPECVAHFWSML